MVFNTKKERTKSVRNIYNQVIKVELFSVVRHIQISKKSNAIKLVECSHQS